MSNNCDSSVIDVSIPGTILRAQKYTSVCFRVGGPNCCPSGSATTYSNTVCIAVPPIPEPNVSIGDINILEGDTVNANALIPVILDDTYPDNVLVEYITQDMEAFAAEPDYIGITGIVNFAPGETRKNITINIVADTNIETHERFKVVLTKATNAKLSSKFEGIVTIINDDSPLPPPPPPPPPGPCVGSLDISGFTLHCNYIHRNSPLGCPSAGSHVCDRAIFNIYINNTFIGKSNLNNGRATGGYYRYTNFTIPSGIVADINGEYKVELRADASLTSVHRGIAEVSIVDTSGNTIFASCMPNDKVIFVPTCLD